MKLNNQNLSFVLKNYKTSQNSFISKNFFIPLEQEHSVDYKSIVNIGDTVKEGQIIATSVGNFGNTTYIHSPVPGKITDICPCYTPSGKQKFAISINFGGEFSYLGKKIKEKDIESLSSSSILTDLMEKGVVNTFDLRKISNPAIEIKKNESKKQRNLVVRLFDEDPFRITDSLVAKFYTKEIILGAKVLAKALASKSELGTTFSADKGDSTGIIFAVDQKFENKKELEDFASSCPEFKILPIKTKKVPRGTVREIIGAFKKSGLKKTCNFEISKDDFFTDSSTLYEVYKAVVCSIPSVSKPVHFSGNCLYSSCVLDVKLGTPLKDIVNQLGGFSKEPSLIIINGLLYGNSVESMNVPITKAVKSVEFVSKSKITDAQIYSCVNCGNCRGVCPVKISPDVLYSYAVNFKQIPDNLIETAGFCEECGLCNTVCPARLPLTKTICWIKDSFCNSNLKNDSAQNEGGNE